MPLIVDGDNLLGTWPGRRRSDRERRTLAHQIQRWARDRRKRVVVVFDGTAPPGLSTGTDLRFSGQGRTADDVILAWLRDQRDRRGWTVVTSDRSLGDQCRHLEARIQRSDRFRADLDGGADGEKPERETDVEGWLRLFEEPDELDP